MEQRIVVEPDAVDGRLAELGLDTASLLEVVRRGHYRYLAGTENDPPGAPSYDAWAYSVRALREYLVPLGWLRCNDDNFPLTVHASGNYAIQVATGDEGTGFANATPATKQSKGPKTAEAISANQVQLNLFPSLPLPAVAPGQLTWILLIHRSPQEVRCELSLPVSIGANGRVDWWRERIILGTVPQDDEYNPARPDLPDIDFDVTRRA